MSFTRTYKAEQTHKGKLEYMMGQVLKGQQKMRCQVCAVLLRSGKRLTPSTAEITSVEKLPETENATIILDEEEEESEEDVEIDRQEGNNVDRPTMINIDRQTGNNVDRHSIPAKPAVERVYRTFPLLSSQQVAD